MNIPTGTKIYIGPPAKPMPVETREKITQALKNIEGIREAHLPQCYAEGVIDPSAQVLFLVVQATDVKTLVSTVQRNLSTVLPPDEFLDVFPLSENSPLLEPVRASQCRLEH
jgi:hypothetical protein